MACSILVFIMAKKRNYPVKKFSWKEVGQATKEALLSLLTPIIIIGGIWTGVFSPTEAACIAALYAFILAVPVYHELGWKDVYQALIETARDSAGILCLICGAAAFSWLVTMLGMTRALSTALVSLTDNKYVMLLIVNIAFLIIGMFMEALAAMTITLPFLVPLMAGAEPDDRPLHPAGWNQPLHLRKDCTYQHREDVQGHYPLPDPADHCSVPDHLCSGPGHLAARHPRLITGLRRKVP